MDVSLFVELEEELGLFGKNHFYISFPGNRERPRGNRRLKACATLRRFFCF